MTTTLNAPRPQPRRVLPLSVAAWHGLIRDNLAPARAELIRGTIIEKMPKSFHHTLVTSRLFNQLTRALPGGCWVRKEEPLTLADSEPEPDISVADGEMESHRAQPGTARFVAEVAVSTLADDRALADLYAEAGVTEYWIVNVPERSLEVYRQPVNGRYESVATYGAGQSVTCVALPVSVDVAALFADLPA